MIDFHSLKSDGLHIYGFSATIISAAKNAPPGAGTGTLVTHKAGAYVAHTYYSNDGKVWNEMYNGSAWSQWDLKDLAVTYAALGTGTILKSGHVVAADIINAKSNTDGVLDISVPAAYLKPGWQMSCTYFANNASAAGKLVIGSSGSVTLYSANNAKVANATLVTGSSAWII